MIVAVIDKMENLPEACVLCRMPSLVTARPRYIYCHLGGFEMDKLDYLQSRSPHCPLTVIENWNGDIEE